MKTIIKYLFKKYLDHSKKIRETQRNSANYETKKALLIKIFSAIKLTPKKWEKVNDMIKWRKDPLWQLGDAITDPYKSLMEKGDDCDGFASVAVVILGKKFSFMNIDFVFDGMYFSFYRKSGLDFAGHCIGIWRSNKYLLAISSQEMRLYKTSKELFKDCMADKLYYVVKCSVPDSDIFDVHFEKIYDGDELHIDLIG